MGEGESGRGDGASSESGSESEGDGAVVPGAYPHSKRTIDGPDLGKQPIFIASSIGISLIGAHRSIGANVPSMSHGPLAPLLK